MFFDNMRRKSDAVPSVIDGKKPYASETGDDLLLLDLLAGSVKKDGSIFSAATAKI